MLTVFQVCFFVGVGLIVLSFIFGNLFDISGFDGFDLDFEVFGLDLFFPINFTLYVLFLTVFGGIGWIVEIKHPTMGTVLAIIIAIAAGFVVSAFVNVLIIKPLKKAQNTSAPSEEELIGVRAKVTETIFAEGFGEVRYTIHGNSYTAPAKSTTGEEIKVGNDVAICWIKKHVFYVVRMDG